MTADDLTRLRDVAIEAAKYKRGDRSMLAGEAFSAWANQVTPPTVAALIDRVERAERERGEFDQQAVAEHRRAEEWRGEAQRNLRLSLDYMAERDAVVAELAALRAAVAGLADEWAAAARDFTDQADGMAGDRASKFYAAADKYALHAQRLQRLLTEGADDGQ